MTELIDDCVYYCASYNQQFENQEIKNNIKNLIYALSETELQIKKNINN